MLDFVLLTKTYALRYITTRVQYEFSGHIEAESQEIYVSLSSAQGTYTKFILNTIALHALGL